MIAVHDGHMDRVGGLNLIEETLDQNLDGFFLLRAWPDGCSIPVL